MGQRQSTAGNGGPHAEIGELRIDQPWSRAVTFPVGGAAGPRRGEASHGGHKKQLGRLEEEGDDEMSMEVPRRRACSEPAPLQRGPLLLEALNAMDSGLPFDVHAPASKRSPSLGLNGVLCAVSLLVSCLCPALVDLSRTATAFGPGGASTRRLPYSVTSVLQCEAAFNVCLGAAAIAARRSRGAFAPLLSAELHLMMLPLTMVYCLGDVAALFAIGHGGGPLYIAVSNSRLLFAAAVSHALLGRHQSLRQWLLLAEICLATAVYCCLTAGSSRGHGSTQTRLQTFIGFSWALVKAALSGTAAVLTESRYKRMDLWHANTLLKAQSFAVSVLLMCLAHVAGEEMPLCGDTSHDGAWCTDRRGWDIWTWFVLVAEISAGWLSVAVLTRMSAIAKFVCKTATAPTLYLIYCATGFGGLAFEASTFAAVLAIAVGIVAYTLEPHLATLRQLAENAWAGEYSQPRRPRP